MNELKPSPNAVRVLEKRYLLKDSSRKIIETPLCLFERVARHVAMAEDNFRNARPKRQEAREKFLDMMLSLEFMPNSPALMNAGTAMGQLSACFVIPVEDSIPGIFKALSDMAGIHQTGGGTGLDFSSLRPKGDLVYSTSSSRRNYQKGISPISIFRWL